MWRFSAYSLDFLQLTPKVSKLLTPENCEEETQGTSGTLATNSSPTQSSRPSLTSLRSLSRDRDRDRLGLEIPNDIKPAFDTKTLRELKKRIAKINGEIRENFKSGTASFSALSQLILIDLANVETKLKEAVAYCVCPMCRGSRCYQCNNRGFLTKKQYDRLPSEYRNTSNT